MIVLRILGNNELYVTDGEDKNKRFSHSWKDSSWTEVCDRFVLKVGGCGQAYSDHLKVVVFNWSVTSPNIAMLIMEEIPQYRWSEKWNRHSFFIYCTVMLTFVIFQLLIITVKWMLNILWDLLCQVTSHRSQKFQNFSERWSRIRIYLPTLLPYRINVFFHIINYDIKKVPEQVSGCSSLSPFFTSWRTSLLVYPGNGTTITVIMKNCPSNYHFHRCTFPNMLLQRTYFNSFGFHCN